MPNLNYTRGRASEYKAIKELKDDGYNTARTAGSHGAADIIAWNQDCIRFIQIKTYKKTEGNYKENTEWLLQMPRPPHSQVEIWTRQSGQRGWKRKELISSDRPPTTK